MNYRKKLNENGFAVIVSILALTLAVSLSATKTYAANSIIIGTTNGGTMVVDLENAAERDAFRKDFADDPMVSGCFRRADFAVDLMVERDNGATLEEHLQKVEDQYEQTKLASEGAIPWHLYIDFGRTVRDVHRGAGSNSEGKYRYTDPSEVWVREFRWCAVDR